MHPIPKPIPYLIKVRLPYYSIQYCTGLYISPPTHNMNKE